MRTTLLSSSALALIAGLASSAVAEPARPSLKISGETIGSMHFFKNSNSGNSTTSGGTDGKGRGTHFALENSRLNFDVSGRADWMNSLEYGWLLGITGDTDNEKSIEEHAIRLRNNWGLLKFGDAYGVDNTLAKGPFAVVGGVGGAINGNYTNVINTPTGVITTNDLSGATKYATKITYISPSLEGFHIGVSYTPDAEHKGETKVKTFQSKSAPKKAYDQNSWSGGINYIGKVAEVNFTLSVTGIAGHTRAPIRGGVSSASSDAQVFLTGKRHNTRALALGGSFDVRGFEFGVEFIDNGKSQQPKKAGLLTTNFNAGKVWSFGAAYNFGPDKFSAGYYTSKRTFNSQQAKAEVVSFGWDRRVAPGLGVFGEYNNFKMRTHANSVAFQNRVAGIATDQAKGVGNNKGHAVVGGFKVSF